MADTKEKQGGGGEITDDVRRALGIVGSVRTPKKSASSAENGKLGGRPLKDLADILCNCGAGDSLDHKSTCPRGRVIRRRAKEGKPQE